MEKYLKFFDSHHPERQSYWQIDNINQDNRIEIMWHGKNVWRFKNLGETFWTETDTASIVEQLELKQADVYAFEVQLKQKIVEMVVLANTIYRKGTELFGTEFIEQAIQDYDNFFKQLIDVIDQVLGEKKKEKFIVINGEKK